MSKVPEDLMHWITLRTFLANGIEYLSSLTQTEEIKGQMKGYKITLNEMNIIEKQWL